MSEEREFDLSACGWKPQFPMPKDRGVKIFDDECAINIMSGSVVISTRGTDVKDVPVDPACICIDEKHIYIRRNWENWYTVDVSNNFFVQKLMASPRCSIYDSVEGELKEYHIPVFKMSTFPSMLFRADQLDATLGSASIDGDDESSISKPDEKPRVRLDRVPPAIEECMDGLLADTFPNVVMEGRLADIAFSTDRLAVICNLWKSENPLDAEKMEEDLNFIRGELLSNEPGSECHMVIVSDSPGMIKPKFEATKVMTEKGLIGFLQETFQKLV